MKRDISVKTISTNARSGGLVLFLFSVSLLFIGLLSTGCAVNQAPEPHPPATGSAGDGTLETLLNHVNSKYNLPALAGFSIRSGSVVEEAAVGLRAMGHSTGVTTNDKWHIGSITKSMTSTLAAILIEQGFLTWQSTLEQIFPDQAETMITEYRDIRLEELLTHTSGLSDNLGDDAFLDSFVNNSSPIIEQRLQILDKVLGMVHSSAERDKYTYSNMGYIIAGAMMERATGQSWEHLITTQLFQPLNMTQTGFRAPGNSGQQDQPWGHYYDNGQWQAIDPGNLESDNPAVVGPAGSVHSSFHDLAIYFSAHLAGARGTAGIVSVESFKKLHTPAEGIDYAMGWTINNKILIHDGSNNRWFALIAINPQQDTAVFAVTNAGEKNTSEAVVEVIDTLIKRLEAAD